MRCPIATAVRGGRCSEPAFVRSCRGVSLRVSACAVAQVGRWAGENYRPMCPRIASKNARAQTCEHAPSLVGSPNARNLCRRALAKRGYPFIFGCRCVTTIVSCNSGGARRPSSFPPGASHRVELNSYCTATLTRNPINNGIYCIFWCMSVL